MHDVDVVTFQERCCDVTLHWCRPMPWVGPSSLCQEYFEWKKLSTKKKPGHTYEIGLCGDYLCTMLLKTPARAFEIFWCSCFDVLMKKFAIVLKIFYWPQMSFVMTHLWYPGQVIIVWENNEHS